jgi:uncharacterized protein YkwD
MSSEEICQGVLLEMNLARTDPERYSQKLQESLKFYEGNILVVPNKTRIMTNEGPPAVVECINFLKSASRLSALKWSPQLSEAANSHASDTGLKGIFGHVGSDGSNMRTRVERFCKWQGTIGENIAYGNETAEEIVVSLLVDDGVASRGHRTNIFQNEFNEVGVAFCPHSAMRTVCVIDYASEVSDKE